MDEFTIPTRTIKQYNMSMEDIKTSNIEGLSTPLIINLEERDTALLEKINPKFYTAIYYKINQLNSDALMNINKIVNCNHQQKLGYVQLVGSTYDFLMSSLSKCLNSDNKLFEVKIHGRYDCSYSTPNLEFWQKCNPEKTFVIDYFINELRTKGWNPRIEGINEYTVDKDDGMYSGGNILILKCEFDK